MSATTRLPYLATAALSGLLFGAGLYVSQMIDPLKVLRFLDVTAIPEGQWDPSLAFVIVPAIAVMAVAVLISRRRQTPAFAAEFNEPEFSRIDRPLLTGAALFGVGWGMSGLCPGPAIALVPFWPEHLAVFLLAMFVGSYAGSFIIPSGHDKRLALAK